MLIKIFIEIERGRKRESKSKGDIENYFKKYLLINIKGSDLVKKFLPSLFVSTDQFIFKRRIHPKM